MRSRRHTLIMALQAASLAALAAHAARAQTSQGVVEIGAAHLRHRDIAGTDAVTLGTTVRRDGRRYAIAAAGGLTLADEGRSTSQGLLTASILQRPGGRTRWELGGAVTAFAQGSLSPAAGAYVTAREHFAIGRFGGWAGVAIGGVEDAEVWSPTRTVEIASWYARWGTRLSATAVRVDTRSEPYGPDGQLVTDPITYTDGSLGARWTFRRRLELDARGGLRVVSRGALTPNGRATRAFAAVDAAVWLTPRVAIVAGMGRQLSDLARGTPDTRFAALALRFAIHDRPNLPKPIRRPAPFEQLRLAVLTDSTGGPRLVVTAPLGERVDLAATFTSWEPVPLVRNGDVWLLDRVVPSGVHRVLVRVDGGPWTVPRNLPAAADDFGGTVGLITIP